MVLVAVGGVLVSINAVVVRLAASMFVNEVVGELLLAAVNDAAVGRLVVVTDGLVGGRLAAAVNGTAAG